MTPDQITLLRDKAQLWRREAAQGNMELRDYNRRCADALEALLSQVPDPAPRQPLSEPDDGCWYGIERCSLPHCDCNALTAARAKSES